MVLLLLFLLALAAALFLRFHREVLPRAHPAAFRIPNAFELAALPAAHRFDFPIGSEHGALTYNATFFTEDRHLGEDLNGIGGENSDLGDPVFAVADGRVWWIGDGGPGWGNIVILLHALEKNGVRKYLQSYYAHLHTIAVLAGQDIRRGQQIATIGNASGRYWAHLHFEMREFLTPFIGPGYRQDTRGWIDPSELIRQHRGAPEDEVGRAPALEQVEPVQAGRQSP